MRRAMMVLSAVFALVAAELSAQERPNFSGSWTVSDAGAVQGARAARRGTPPDGAPAAGARAEARAARGAGAGGRAGGGGGRGAALLGLGRQATITQDGATLTITRTTQAGEIKSVYKLDGSDSPNTISGPNGNTVEQLSHAKWDGSKLTITTSSTMGGRAIESTMVLSLDASGALVVESGGMGRGDRGAGMTMKYTKG